MIVFLLAATTTTNAQRNKKQTRDSLTVYREFAKLGQWYLSVPLQMNVHFMYLTTPAMTEQDSLSTDMILYYGKNNFYMQTEGMEQIANDTLVVVVNNEAKMIKLYPNNGQLLKNLEKIVTMMLPDSSIERFAERYSARIQDEEKGIKRITIQSKDKISGTDLFKEAISITYQPDTYQPVTYRQSKMSVVPVDSTVYNQLASDNAYAGRLINSRSDANNLFFAVREKIIQCRFTDISHEKQMPPALEKDRVIRIANGEYQPAKGFEDYLVSKEF